MFTYNMISKYFILSVKTQKNILFLEYFLLIYYYQIYYSGSTGLQECEHFYVVGQYSHFVPKTWVPICHDPGPLDPFCPFPCPFGNLYLLNKSKGFYWKILFPCFVYVPHKSEIILCLSFSFCLILSGMDLPVPSNHKREDFILS